MFLQIVLINIVLSGDNAVVIAMASKNLPIHQRKQAIWWGAFGAVILRVILTIVAVFLLNVPYIQAVGSLLLIYIAIKLLADEEGSKSNIKQAASLAGAIQTIIVADFVMSLDNVLAIAAIANKDYFLIVLGVGLSIPLIVWGSTIIMKLLHKFPILIYIGAGILGYTAGEMVMHDHRIGKMLEEASPSFDWILPVGATVLVIVAGLVIKWMSSKKHQNQ